MTCLDSLRKLITSIDDEWSDQYNRDTDRVKLLELCARALDSFLAKNNGVCLTVDLIDDAPPRFMIKMEVPYINISDKEDDLLAVLQVATSLVFEAADNNEDLIITLTLPGIWADKEYE